jgi:non-canonical (house-cleaning) NTP pyrophosphatase
VNNAKKILAKDGVKFDFVAAIENGLFVQHLGDEEVWMDVGWVLIEDTEGNFGVSVRYKCHSIMELICFL